MVNPNKAEEIAQAVRHAIDSIPPLESTTLEVDDTGIYSTESGGKKWWHVPITPNPWPMRMYPLYEVLAEIEGALQDEQGLDILLFAGEPTEIISAEPTLNVSR